MLCIENIRFWCKVEGFLDRINAPEIVLRIILQDTFALPHLQGKTQKNTTDWSQHEIPPIQLSPYQQKYKIQFALYREGELIGMGQTQFKFKQSRKDCLDIVDKQFRISGKLVYELNWIKNTKSGNYISYETFTNNKTSSAQGGGKEVILTKQIKTQREKKYVRQEDEEDCSSGICACFAVRKKKKKTEDPMPQNEQKVSQKYKQSPRVQANIMIEKPPKKMQGTVKSSLSKFTNNPYVYFQEQLDNRKINDVQQLNRLSFYSKVPVISK